MQLRHFLNNPLTCNAHARQYTLFEIFCTKTKPQRHIISNMYSLLFSNHSPKSNIACQHWERDLAIDLSEEEWENIYSYIHKGSTNVSAQENGFRIFSRWYKTPLRLNKISPTIPPNCWRCADDDGSLLHLLWSCPQIQPFWMEVHRLTSLITMYPLDFSPAQLLLHHSTTHKTRYHKSLSLHLINAAKMCIPARWKTTTPQPL